MLCFSYEGEVQFEVYVKLLSQICICQSKMGYSARKHVGWDLISSNENEWDCENWALHTRIEPCKKFAGGICVVKNYFIMIMILL